MNSTKYYARYPFLSEAKFKKSALRWNDTLAKAAESKAMDMANRNYFGHIDPDGYGMNYYINKCGYNLNSDWTREKEDNNFESICVDAESGEKAIEALIIDDGIPSLGHRIHLLGMDSWNSSLVDIGIGFVRSDSESNYRTYISVLIAKHDW